MPFMRTVYTCDTDSQELPTNSPPCLSSGYATPVATLKYSPQYFASLTFFACPGAGLPREIATSSIVKSWSFTDNIPSTALGTVIQPGELVPFLDDVLPISREMAAAFAAGSRAVRVRLSIEGMKGKSIYIPGRPYVSEVHSPTHPLSKCSARALGFQRADPLFLQRNVASELLATESPKYRVYSVRAEPSIFIPLTLLHYSLYFLVHAYKRYPTTLTLLRASPSPDLRPSSGPTPPIQPSLPQRQRRPRTCRKCGVEDYPAKKEVAFCVHRFRDCGKAGSDKSCIGRNRAY
ncbi:hypothetical protein R3P38DRAFT_3292429 [Favolaschia claudopus]|uniref:PDZ domain-containing protein n=1 Tax=Favolaschia claudopus TaxID=2862362 RepID=A0AAV9ZJH3_9AGAR